MGLTACQSACSNLVMASTICKGRLNFGLVSIPIKLSRAARAEKIHMHKLQRETGMRVRQVFVPTESETRWDQHTSMEQSPQLPAIPQPTPGRGNDGTTARAVSAAAPTEPPVDRPQGRGTQTPGLSREDIVHGFEYEKDR